MAMSKKDFIALADAIRGHNERNGNRQFTIGELNTLADFCASTNQRFMRGRWLSYIAGECGSNGGHVKHVKVLHGLCNVCGHYGEDCTGKVART